MKRGGGCFFFFAITIGPLGMTISLDDQVRYQVASSYPLKVSLTSGPGSNSLGGAGIRVVGDTS